MAITKDYLNTNDVNVFAAWMQANLVPDYFAAVTVENAAVTCTDADGNTLLTISWGTTGGGNLVLTFNAYKSGSYATTFSRGSISVCQYCASCANGALVVWKATNGDNMQQALLITKTNNGKTALIFAGENLYSTTLCIAWGDVAPDSTYSFTPLTANQTQLVPFCTDAALSTPSYTPDAFYIPVGQYYSMGIGKLALDGTTYLTNGYWAIKDE